MTLTRIYQSKQNPVPLWLTVGLIVGLLVMIPFSPAYANGGTTVLMEQVGPYNLTVSASPYPLQVGVTNDISALVGRQTGQQVVLDAKVTMVVTPVEQAGEPQTLPANHDNASNKLYYAANIIFPTPGRWQITVQIDGPDGSATTSFEEQVEKGSGGGALIWSLIGITVGIVAFGLALFMGRRSREA